MIKLFEILYEIQEDINLNKNLREGVNSILKDPEDGTDVVMDVISFLDKKMSEKEYLSELFEKRKSIISSLKKDLKNDKFWILNSNTKISNEDIIKNKNIKLINLKKKNGEDELIFVSDKENIINEIKNDILINPNNTDIDILINNNQIVDISDITQEKDYKFKEEQERLYYEGLSKEKIEDKLHQYFKNADILPRIGFKTICKFGLLDYYDFFKEKMNARNENEIKNVLPEIIWDAVKDGNKKTLEKVLKENNIDFNYIFKESLKEVDKNNDINMLNILLKANYNYYNLNNEWVLKNIKNSDMQKAIQLKIPKSENQDKKDFNKKMMMAIEENDKILVKRLLKDDNNYITSVKNYIKLADNLSHFDIVKSLMTKKDKIHTIDDCWINNNNLQNKTKKIIKDKVLKTKKQLKL